MIAIKQIAVVLLCASLVLGSAFSATAEESAQGELILTLEVDKTKVEVDGLITLTFTLRNNGSTTVRVLDISSPFVLWICIIDKNGSYVYRDSLDKDYTEAGISLWGNDQLVELYPGESIVTTRTIVPHMYGMVKAGNYTIIGFSSGYGIWAENVLPHYEGSLASNAVEIQIVGDWITFDEDNSHEVDNRVPEDEARLTQGEKDAIDYTLIFFVLFNISMTSISVGYILRRRFPPAK